MRIAIALISFEHLTGAELYVYELAKRYRELGHEVLITAPTVGGEVAERARSLGAEVYSFEDCPSRWNPDILHVNEYLPAVFELTLYPNTPAVTSVHSQFLVEKPFISDRVYKYICIRPEVQQKITSEYDVTPARTVVIYNGVDFTRFSRLKPDKKKPKNVLFVGTIDRLRRKAIEELIADGKKHSYKVTIVGKRFEDYLDNPPAHVTVLPPVWDIETYLEQATETAGILLGRTTIEGWARGLPGWIYDIDLEGNITSKKLFPPPEDIQKFNINHVADSILKVYEEAITHAGSLQFDDTSLAESRALVIAQLVAANAKLLYHAGAIETLNGIVNQLGAQTHELRLRAQQFSQRQDLQEGEIIRLKEKTVDLAWVKRQVKKVLRKLGIKK